MKRTRKALRPVSATTLLKKASVRQKRLYGINGPRVPAHEQWRYSIDETYLSALAGDPRAALWLSVFNEGERGVYIAGEPHVHTLAQVQQADRERKRREYNQVVMSFGALRGPSMEDEDGRVDPSTENAEDDIIARLDRAKLRGALDGHEGD